MAQDDPITKTKDEMPPEILNKDGLGPVIILCDHASNHIPEDYDNLGLAGHHLDDHIAWDIGAAEVTRQLAEELKAPAVLARFSRLLIDANRHPHQETLIAPVSDGIVIPGNATLPELEKLNRIEKFYRPFHDACADVIDGRLRQGPRPFIIAMHSFTPRMNGFDRPWEAAFLWDQDPTLAAAFIMRLRAQGLTAGDNEPYSGKELFYTMNRHGYERGLPQTTVEVRQDELATPESIDRWVNILGACIQDIAREFERKTDNG